MTIYAKQIVKMIPLLSHLELISLRSIMVRHEIKLESELRAELDSEMENKDE